jgi:uncharacterized protein YbjT (DUF2867 family)
MADEDEETIPKKPLFVLGAGGFVGGEISRAFVQVEDEEGWEVTGTLRPGTAKPKWLAHVVEVRARAAARIARQPRAKGAWTQGVESGAARPGKPLEPAA